MMFGKKRTMETIKVEDCNIREINITLDEPTAIKLRDILGEKFGNEGITPLYKELEMILGNKIKSRNNYDSDQNLIGVECSWGYQRHKVCRDEVTIPRDEYESMKSTLEVLSDPELMEQIRESHEDMNAGRCKSLRELIEEME